MVNHNFAESLRRLREASVKRGTYQTKTTVELRDLNALLAHFDRLDAEVRSRHAQETRAVTCDSCGWEVTRGSHADDCPKRSTGNTSVIPEPIVPVGHFWRGERDRYHCRNCGRHYDEHNFTDESSLCPTANR